MLDAKHAAARLGWAGVLPFAACSILLWTLPPTQALGAARALTVYAAIIVSFMGAVHWGLVIAPRDRDPSLHSLRWLTAGVMPALAAWFALMLPAGSALMLLALVFVAAYGIDRAAVAARLAPLWYGTLRGRLTAAVVSLLAADALVAWARLR